MSYWRDTSLPTIFPSYQQLANAVNTNFMKRVITLSKNKNKKTVVMSDSTTPETVVTTTDSEVVEDNHDEVIESEPVVEAPVEEVKEPVIEKKEEPKVIETPLIDEVKKFIPEEPMVVPVKTLRPGQTVMICTGCKMANGNPLPTFAFKNEYRIVKILSSRVIIKAGEYTIAVKPESIITEF